MKEQKSRDQLTLTKKEDDSMLEKKADPTEPGVH